MDKSKVIEHLQDYKKKGFKVAVVKANIASQGVDVYTNETIRVGLNNPTPLKPRWGQEYCACDTIEEFNEGIVFGLEGARKAYTRCYVSVFISVEVGKTI